MSTAMEEEFKRCTAKRKVQLVLDMLQGRTTMAEASLTHDLTPSEIAHSRAAGSLSRSDAADACFKTYQSLLGDDDK